MFVSFWRGSVEPEFEDVSLQVLGGRAVVKEQTLARGSKTIREHPLENLKQIDRGPNEW